MELAAVAVTFWIRRQLVTSVALVDVNRRVRGQLTLDKTKSRVPVEVKDGEIVSSFTRFGRVEFVERLGPSVWYFVCIIVRE